MKHSLLLKTALIATAIPLLAGCVQREVVYRDRPVYVQAPPPGAPPVAVSTDPAPPAVQVEAIPVAPDPSYVWIAGNWEWRGRWVWVGGRWAPRPYAGAVWVRSGWVWRGHHRVWVSGHWY